MDLQTEQPLTTGKSHGNHSRPHRQTPPFRALVHPPPDTCVVVCAFLAFVNWQTSPHYWWVLWVIAGWGLNIALSLAWYLFDCDDECNYRNR